MKSSLIELRVGTRQKTPKAMSLKTGALTVDEHTAFNEWQDITEAVQHAA